MLKAKRWLPVTYQVGDSGEAITMEIRRLRYPESSPFNLSLAKAWAAFGNTTKESSRADQALAQQRFYESLPLDKVEEAFRDWVRNVGGIEDDDGEITTGERLYEVADENLVLFVLSAIRANSTLSAEEGKASASPSTSEPELARETDGGVSPAGPAGNGDGTSPETAPESQDDQRLFSAPV